MGVHHFVERDGLSLAISYGRRLDFRRGFPHRAEAVGDFPERCGSNDSQGLSETFSSSGGGGF